MAKLSDGLEYKLALRGQSVTLRAQPLSELHTGQSSEQELRWTCRANSRFLSVPLEPSPDMRLQGLAPRGHVERPEQVALDHAVEPVPGGVLRG